MPGFLHSIGWDAFKGAILQVLVAFYHVVGDYGVAIVLLTVAMRILLTPLVWKQTKSMMELQQVQPKIKAIQDKYKGNKEKQQEELMKFYQENKVNPFGGCLPLLLQMPIFVALYGVLGQPADSIGPTFAHQLVEIGQKYGPQAAVAAKRFWIILPDLTMSPSVVFQPFLKAVDYLGGVGHALPYLLLVALFGVSTWLPQYLMTKDPTQRKTGAYMAIFMLFIGWSIPGGVLVYWVTSSAWQVGQQIIMQRLTARAKGA